MNKFGRFSVFHDAANIVSGSKYDKHLDGDILKQFQACLLEIAKAIIDICEEENIAYFLGGGTALGAVRHGGFIPWDDDMDINMLFCDYARFKSSFLHKYGEHYSIKDKSTKGYNILIPRVIRKGSFIDRIDDADGFCVDIFLWQNTPDSAVLRALHGLASTTVSVAFSCWTIARDRKIYMNVAKHNPKVRWPIYLEIMIGGIAHILSLDVWRKIAWYVDSLCKNNNSVYITVPQGKRHYFKSLLPRDKIIPTTKKTFEGYSWNVAGDYDSHLTMLYGPEYMTPPPPEKQEHHYYKEIVFPEDAD